MLPLRARVDLGAMAMNGYSASPQTLVLLEPQGARGVMVIVA